MDDLAKLKIDLDSVAKWCELWSMELNDDKRKVMNSCDNDIVIIGILHCQTIKASESASSKLRKNGI